MPEKVKANPDYSPSAVNLCNPKEVEELIARYHFEQLALETMALRVEAYIPHALQTEMMAKTTAHSETEKALREAVDQYGSYQNQASGLYAVKQKRQTVNYSPYLTRQNLDAKMAELVIVEAVDSKALAGLVKGGLITAEDAAKCGTVTEAYAYIIKVVPAETKKEN